VLAAGAAYPTRGSCATPAPSHPAPGTRSVLGETQMGLEAPETAPKLRQPLTSQHHSSALQPALPALLSHGHHCLPRPRNKGDRTDGVQALAFLIPSLIFRAAAPARAWDDLQGPAAMATLLGWAGTDLPAPEHAPTGSTSQLRGLARGVLPSNRVFGAITEAGFAPSSPFEDTGWLESASTPEPPPASATCRSPAVSVPRHRRSPAGTLPYPPAAPQQRADGLGLGGVLPAGARRDVHRQRFRRGRLEQGWEQGWLWLPLPPRLAGRQAPSPPHLPALCRADGGEEK